MAYYDEYDNDLYNPDDGHDSKLPGDNANWKAIQKGFKAVEDDITDLDDRLIVTESNVENLTERVEVLEGDVNDLTSTVSTLSSDVDTLKDDMINAQNDITQLRTDVDTNTEDISGLKTRMSSAESSISQLETDVHINRLDINVNADDISSLKTRMSTAEGNITTINTKNTQQDARLDAIEQVNTQQTQRLSSAEGNITANANAVNALGVRVTRAEDDIDALEADVNKLKTETAVETNSVTSGGVTGYSTRAVFKDADGQNAQKGKAIVNTNPSSVELENNDDVNYTYFAASIRRDSGDDIIAVSKSGESDSEHNLTSMETELGQIRTWSGTIQTDVNKLKNAVSVHEQQSGGTSWTSAEFTPPESGASKVRVDGYDSAVQVASDTYSVTVQSTQSGDEIVVSNNGVLNNYPLGGGGSSYPVRYITEKRIKASEQQDLAANSEQVVNVNGIYVDNVEAGTYLVLYGTRWVNQVDVTPVSYALNQPYITVINGGYASLNTNVYVKNMGTGGGSMYYGFVTLILLKIGDAT